jgi:PKHD-type hydroxylase
MKSPNPSWDFFPDMTENFAFWQEAFTPEQCDDIIRAGKERVLEPGKVSAQNVLKEDYRKSNVAFLTPSEIRETYQKLTDYVLSLNERYFRFDISGFNEELQFTEYETGGVYNAHIDKQLRERVRKLTVVVQLSDPLDYEGGDLELIFGDEGKALPRDRGMLLLFPSYVLHRVTPVTSGTRHTLVGWITGKPFN